MGLSEKALAHRKAQKKEYRNRPAVKSRIRARIKRWSAEKYGSENRYQRHRSYLARYGITIDEYELMLVNQKSSCLLCGRGRDSKKHLAVDHDHITGRVRGLLCTFCNLMAARVDADPTLTRRLQEYCHGGV